MRHRSLLVLTAALSIATAANAQSQTIEPANAAPVPNPVSSAAPDAPASTPAPAAGKKVWTNEDVSDLRTNSTISTVGSTDTKRSAKTAPAAKPRNPRQYQAQIARLEGQIPALDQQIAELQDAIDGKPTGDAKSSKRPRSVQADDWNVQMQNLQKKKQDLLDQIAAMKDEARHQGVPPNTLP
jgi:chaperonin cofactor prefoldin